MTIRKTIGSPFGGEDGQLGDEYSLSNPKKDKGLGIERDLFAILTPPCGDCPNLGDAIDSGLRYCWGEMTWRWPDDRVEGCVYRGRQIERRKPPTVSLADCLRDLLTDPRHSIDDKGRKWLRAELRREERSAA